MTKGVSRSSSFEQGTAMLGALVTEAKKIGVVQHEVVEQVLISFIANGHLLIEGAPGLGGSVLVRGLAKCFGGTSGYVQCTPDLAFTDVTGHALFNIQTQGFAVRKGPLFSNLLLVDELYRAPAKTQAALLQVLDAGDVSIEDDRYAVPAPFMAVATVNPCEPQNNNPLTQAQLDRFMMKLVLGYPSVEDEHDLLKQAGCPYSAPYSQLDYLRTLVSPGHILALRKLAREVHVDDAVVSYVVELVRATRTWHGVLCGVGPRASASVMAAAKARALLRGRSFVTSCDVRSLALPCLRHRLAVMADATDASQVISDILRDVPRPTG